MRRMNCDFCNDLILPGTLPHALPRHSKLPGRVSCKAHHQLCETCWATMVGLGETLCKVRWDQLKKQREEKPCPHCEASGQLFESRVTCPFCDGSGIEPPPPEFCKCSVPMEGRGGMCDGCGKPRRIT